MSVGNGQQNKHRWWGYLTIDPDTVVINGILMPGVRCVFVKTSRHAHFIGEGTYIGKVRIFNSKSEAANAIGAGQDPDIYSDLNASDFPSDLPIVEIFAIDEGKTTPLAKKLNTETLRWFGDEQWKTDNAEQIGRDAIEAGLEMPDLPLDETQLT